MRSTFSGIETTLRGLRTQQRAVDVINHNIANANTPGFSRQAAIITTTPPYTVPARNMAGTPGQMGTGSTVEAIQRMRAGFLDIQYRDQAQHLGDATARSRVYAAVEAIFNEPYETGFNGTLEQFWQAWHSVTQHPSDSAVRVTLLESATALADGLNSIRQQLQTERRAVANELRMQAGQINELAQRIAGLNAEISKVLGSGQQPNDLMDQRDLLLDQLRELTNASVVPVPGGAVNVYIGGRPLVDRVHASAIDATQDPISGDMTLTWQDDGSPVAVTSGTLNGLLHMHNVALPRIIGDIEAILDTLVAEVNAQHQLGYGLNDPAGPPPGRDFFEVLPNGDIRVSAALIADPSLVAVSAIAGTPGNADIALAIAAIRDKLTLGAGSASIGDFYQTLVARVGSEARQAINDERYQESLARMIDRRRQEVSSVSLDEEAANLVKFQHAYQAAARAMTVVDEMLDLLINRTGVVGR